MTTKASGLLAAAVLFGTFGGCGNDSESPGAQASGSGGALGGSSAGVAGANQGAAQSASGGGHVGAGAGGVNGSAGSAAGSSSAGTSAAAGSAGMAAVNCPVVPELAAWPGKDAVKTLDTEGQFQSDLSGLTYEPGPNPSSGVLWAVNNLSSRLFRLLQTANGFVPDTANGWSAGKLLHFPNGQGGPDSEGVTLAANLGDGVYVCSEHDTDNASTSRMSILRYDVSGDGASLNASHEWNLTALLPAAGANTGVEAITWVPDAFLTAKGFVDDAKAHVYAPADYAEHGSGLFFVGVEETGKLHVVALNHSTSTAALITTISTLNAGVMGLEFDRDAGNLWFNCDDSCDNQSGVLDVDTRAGSPSLGHFVLRRKFQRPNSLPNSNNEGIAVAPAAECNAGFKRFFWTDDADQDGFSLRTDLIPCETCL